MSLADLRSYINCAAKRLAEDPPEFGRVDAMRQARMEMQARHGMADGRNDDRIAQALSILRSDGPKAALTSHCRWVCWGLTKAMPGGPLLASRHLFPPTLAAIEEAHAAKLLPTGAWRGLVDGYFSPDAELRTQAEANWHALRGFLARSLPDIRARSRALPDWLAQLAGYPDLLGEAPCAAFAADVLAGHQNRIDTLREALSIEPESWFWEQLILAQVRHAATLPDEHFRQVLDNLLAVVSKHPGIVNAALAGLLTRYAGGLTHEAHEGLKALAVEKWGSPNLITQATWNKVEPQVKRMVQEWLVREDLVDFFDILKDKQETDQRRLNFWLRYHKQMDFARLAFGNGVLHSRDADTRDLLKKKKGRYAALTDSGGANNAIIMKLGPFFFVEFSQTGNAAYGYHEERVPFDVYRPSLSIHALKRSVNDFREPHGRSTGYGRWEDLYDARLAAFGIFPDPSLHPTAHRATAPTQPSPAHRPNPPPPPKPALPEWERKLDELRRNYGLRGEDKRDRGGNLWVWHLKENDAVAARLAECGFRYMPGKGWWRK